MNRATMLLRLFPRLCGLVAALAFASIAVAEVPARPAELELAFDRSRGRLAAHVEGASLRDVLAALATATGAEVVGAPAAGERVSIIFRDLPIERGLERILEGSSYLLFFRGGGTQLTKIVLAAGGGERIMPEAGAAAVEPPLDRGPAIAVDELDDGSPEGTLPDESAGARIEAIGLLALAGDAEMAAEELRETLGSDPDDEVRSIALGALAEVGPIPGDFLIATALSDRSLDLRLDAVERLRRDHLKDPASSAALVQIAESDPLPELRAIAADVLREADGFDD